MIKYSLTSQLLMLILALFILHTILSSYAGNSLSSKDAIPYDSSNVLGTNSRKGNKVVTIFYHRFYLP